MTDAQRDQHIAHYRSLMERSWAEGRRAEARFYCRVWTGLLRGRSPPKDDQRKGAA